MTKENPEIQKTEDAVTNISKFVAGVFVEIALLLALFRYFMPYSLEHGGPFVMLAILAIGVVALAYLSIWNFRLVRKIQTHRKTEQPNG